MALEIVDITDSDEKDNLHFYLKRESFRSYLIRSDLSLLYNNYSQQKSLITLIKTSLPPGLGIAR